MQNLKPVVAPSSALALRHVDHAVADLRRGEMVILRHDGASYVIDAAESLTSEGLARLARLTGRRLSLALTQRRAALIGWAPAPHGPGGTHLIAIPEGSEVEFLRDLADPAAPAGTRLAVAPATVPQGAADAAVELTKLARLLPAAMMGPIDDPTAAELGAD